MSGTPAPTCEYYVGVPCDMHTLRDKKKKRKSRNIDYETIYIYTLQWESFVGQGSTFMDGRSLPFHWFNLCRHACSYPLCTIRVQSSLFCGLILWLGNYPRKIQ